VSEAIYQQVEHAIRERLYVTGTERHPMGGCYYFRPVAIEDGLIRLENEGSSYQPPRWTPEQWRERVTEGGIGLFQRVGFWDFTPADDVAADEIRFAHKSPKAAGRELHSLRLRVAELEGKGDP